MLEGAYLLAGLLAAALAWTGNRFLFSFLKFDGLLWGPLLEEALKTGLALAWGAPVLLVHAAFGLVEAGWELTRARRGAALAAVGGHTLFGVAAAGLWEGSGQAVLAWGGGFLLHFLWNAALFWLHRRGG
ncbi:MAG: hypothetical protein IMW96_04605 [Thermoanaerobacteraceae bacterium]|nr:hypothetical protein [Thermoanaerobacteraceae bacterium]